MLGVTHQQQKFGSSSHDFAPTFEGSIGGAQDRLQETERDPAGRTDDDMPGLIHMSDSDEDSDSEAEADADNDNADAAG